ncbi:MAG: hypothetical protein LQ351_007703 [Letrouitia transgressa]|nr:MAG: hypothetical protein LQ351_007703 [Letrouitia transgressa]
MTDSKVILVTGANTGLGLEIVKSLCSSSVKYDILIGCRDPSKGDTAISGLRQQFSSTLSSLSVIQVDLTSDDSLQQAVDTISSKHGRLDILLNNGGATFDPAIASGSLSIREGFNRSWDVNVTGTHVLTTLAIPLLLKSADPRLIFMTSGTATLTETTILDKEPQKRINASPAAGWPKDGTGMVPIMAYRSSKTGLNMLMREWVRILRNDGVKVWCISPGFLATGLGGAGPEVLKKVRSRWVPTGD